MGSHGEPARDRHALAHAARELARALPSRPASRFDERDELLGDAPRARRGGRPVFTASTASATLSKHAHPGQERVLLEDDAALGPGLRDERAVERDAPPVGSEEPADQRHQRGLARARVADDGHELALARASGRARRARAWSRAAVTNDFSSAADLEVRHSGGLEPRLRPAPIRRSRTNPIGADRDDAQDDVGVDEAVVLLPEEAAHAGRARQHLGGHDDEPGQAERQPVAREDVRQRGRDDDLASASSMRESLSTRPTFR